MIIPQPCRSWKISNTSESVGSVTLRSNKHLLTMPEIINRRCLSITFGGPALIKSDFVQYLIASHLDRGDTDCYGFHSLQRSSFIWGLETTDVSNLWDRDFSTFNHWAPALSIDDSQTDALNEISRCSIIAWEPLLWSSCGKINRLAFIAYNQISVALT